MANIQSFNKYTLKNAHTPIGEKILFSKAHSAN